MEGKAQPPGRAACFRTVAEGSNAFYGKDNEESHWTPGDARAVEGREGPSGKIEGEANRFVNLPHSFGG